jgi:hypothetical protein
VGAWVAHFDDGTSVEFSFNDDGRFYALFIGIHDDYDVSVGIYTVSGDSIHIMTTAAYYDYGDGFEEAGMWPTGDESFIFSVSGNTLTMTSEYDNTLTYAKGSPLGIWSFDLVNSQPVVAPTPEQTASPTPTVDVGHIWLGSASEAEAFLASWMNGPANRDSFVELVNVYVMSGQGGSGELFENVYPGMMIEPVDEWCFDPSRKPGDTGIVESEYGFHVMYFVK